MKTIDPTRLSRKGLLDFAAAFGVFAAAGAAPALAQTTTAAPPVAGAWKLVTFDVENPDGSTGKPRFGPDPVGYLMYTPSGRMSAVLAGTHRPKLVTPGGLSNNEADRTEAIVNFLAYAGKYEVRGDHVLHHIDVSIFTNLMGTTLERQFKISGDELTIRTVGAGVWGTGSVLLWKRA